MLKKKKKKYRTHLEVFDDQIEKELDNIQKRYPNATEKNTLSYWERRIFLYNSIMHVNDWQVLNTEKFYREKYSRLEGIQRSKYVAKCLEYYCKNYLGKILVD
jgi:hypothetical protein